MCKIKANIMCKIKANIMTIITTTNLLKKVENMRLTPKSEASMKATPIL